MKQDRETQRSMAVVARNAVAQTTLWAMVVNG
jgi:hypothetical protein